MVFSSVPIQFRSSSLLSLPFRTIAFQFHIVSSHFQSAAILRPCDSFPSFSDAILYFSYPSQFVPDPFISLSVLFVDNQIRFVSSHFFSNAPQTEPLISHSYQINSMPIRVSANPIFSLSVRFRSTAVQIDPFIGFSGRFGTSPTRLRSLPFLGSSGEFYAFPPRIPATPSHLVANQLQFRPTRLFSAPFRFLAIVSIPQRILPVLFQSFSRAFGSIQILFSPKYHSRTLAALSQPWHTSAKYPASFKASIHQFCSFVDLPVGVFSSMYNP